MKWKLLIVILLLILSPIFIQLGNILITYHSTTPQWEIKEGEAGDEKFLSLPLPTTVLLECDGKLFYPYREEDYEEEYMCSWDNGVIKRTPVGNINHAAVYGDTFYYLEDGIIYRYFAKTNKIKKIYNLEEHYGLGATKTGTDVVAVDDDSIYVLFYQWKEEKYFIDGISILAINRDGSGSRLIHTVDFGYKCFVILLHNDKLYFGQKTDDERLPIFTMDLKTGEITEFSDRSVMANVEMGMPEAYLWNDALIFPSVGKGFGEIDPVLAKLDGSEERVIPITTSIYGVVDDTVYFWNDDDEQLQAYSLVEEAVYIPENTEVMGYGRYSAFQGKLVYYNDSDFEEIRIYLYDPATKVCTRIV